MLLVGVQTIFEDNFKLEDEKKELVFIVIKIRTSYKERGQLAYVGQFISELGGIEPHINCIARTPIIFLGRKFFFFFF